MVQLAPMAVSGLLGTPAVHRSSVQAMPSTNTSVFSATLRGAPKPLHSTTWQSPVVWFPTGRSTPAVVSTWPHVLPLHV